MSEHLPASAPLQRMPTHVPGLDIVLKGGFFRGGLYIITGPPGTGKTVLGNQICFNHVADGAHALYVTLLGEEHTRLFAQLASFSFYAPEQITETILYFSAFDILQQEGLQGLLPFVRRILRDHNATLLLLDGTSVLGNFADSEVALQSFLQGLQVTAISIGATVVMLNHRGETLGLSAHTMADGWMELSYPLVGLRALRHLRVHKHRGSDFLGGQHLFEINSDGFRVYPRSEARLAPKPPPLDEVARRLSVGVPQLDEMLEGGLLTNSVSLLLGVPGTGKTLLGLHYLLAGAQLDEPGLLFSFYEMPPRLIYKAANIGLDLETQVERGMIEIIWQQAVENNLDALAERLLDALEQRGVKRLFLDGLNGFQRAAAYRERLPGFLSVLTDEIRSRGVTAIYTLESRRVFGTDFDVPVHGVSDIVDNVVLLRFVELRAQLHRLISILKARETGFNTAIREFEINSSGIEVADTFLSAEAILTGIARPLPPASTRPSTEALRPDE